MKCIVPILAGAAILFLVLKESTGSELDPLGDNVCSETKTRSRLKRSLFPCLHYSQWWRPRPKHYCRRWRWGGYRDVPVKRKKETYTHYYCCTGWLRSGRHCSIRNPCPKGREKCTDFPIIHLPTPSVSYRNDFAVPKVEMVCSFDFPVWKNVSYLVEWYGRSTKPVKKDTWCVPDQPADAQNDCTRRQSSIVLPDHFALGDTVWCRLFMKFSTNKTNKWTRTGKDSNQYYVGIEVSPRHVIVKECNVAENITVTLRPTIPILPTMNVPGSDSVVVSVLIPQKYKAQRRQAAVDKCQVELQTQDITRGKTITIRGICDNQQDQRQSFSFRFKPNTMSTSWSDVDNYQMPAVKVTVDNTETRLCLTTTDPNLFTFDQRKFFYNELGDYVMYSNQAKKVQVHVRLWICAGQMTCVCGAAIREGKDVIVISMCNKMKDSVPTILRTFKRSPGRLSKGIQITKKISGASLEQEVILSSGIRVSVERSGRSLDVRINAPSTDKGQVLGLCGNYNGDPEDDFNKGGDGKAHVDEKQFAASWRLKEGKSFFEILLDQEQEQEFEQGRSCYCGIEGETKQDERCDDNANLFTRIDATQIEVFNTQINDQSQFGMKRSVDSHWYSDDIIDHVERSYFVDDPHVQLAVNRIRNKRSPREVITEDEATEYCKTHLEKTKAGQTCKEMSAGTNLNNAMIQCVNDLKMTGDKTFAVLAFETMKYICEDNTLKNLSLYTHTASGDLIPPREVVKELCPADCSGHGKCKNRTCICDEGFTALDCSMQVNSVPELLGIYDGGLCDIRERPCKKTSLLGQNFITSKKLTCHIQEVKVYPGTWSPRGIPVTSQGKMTDLFGVQCTLPEPPTRLGDYEHEGTPAGGLLISVSNDGFNTSVQRLRQVTYDSKCMNCSKSGKCKFKANSCLIKGHCFAANEPNPRDWCQYCWPDVDRNAWTSRKNNQAPKFSSKSTYYALQGERLVIQLKATDPDNRPITYSVLSSTATGYTLTTSGLLTLRVKSNQKFTFQVTDECGAFDKIHVTVRIVQCPCLNGATCVPHPYHPRGSGLYQCRCPSGTVGERCLKVCSGAACPRGLKVVPIGSTKLEVHWVKPLDMKSVDYYFLKHGDTDRGLWREKVPKDVTTKTLTGLKKFTSYRVVLSAVNSDGEKMIETVVKTGEDGF